MTSPSSRNEATATSGPRATGTAISCRARSSCLGRPEPDWSSESDTVVPTGATWVDAAGPAPFAGHFVFCSEFEGMKVFIPGSPRASVESGPRTCLYDVVQGPDHALYFSDDQAVYRLA